MLQTARRRRAPGPRGLPWFGQVLRLASDTCSFLTELHASYGDYVGITAAGHRLLCVFDPDAIEHILVKNQKNYIKDAYLRQASDLFGRGLLSNEGDDWLKQRRALQPAFHKQRIDGYGEQMRAAIADWIDAHPAGQSVDFMAEMSALTLDILNRCLFGRKTAGDAREVAQPLHDLLERFAEPGFFLEPLWWPSRGRRRWTRAISDLEAYVATLVAERRHSPGADLLSFMLEAFGDEPTRIRDEALTLLLAGHETTALTLTYAWYLLAEHPHYADAALADPELLDGVIKEAMRLYPPVYMLAREAIGEDEIAGYPIEKRTNVVASQWVMHRDPRYFDAPLEFRPERWKNGLEKQLHKYVYFPFGGGPRMCIGAAFAFLEAKLALTELLRHYAPVRATSGAPVLLQSITLRPKNGLPVMLRPRAC